MKNKKLFAILTLVCFMFTLMPVAAFADDTDLSYGASAIYTVDANAGVAVGDYVEVVFALNDKAANPVATTDQVYVWATEGSTAVPSDALSGADENGILAVGTVSNGVEVTDKVKFLRPGTFTLHAAFEMPEFENGKIAAAKELQTVSDKNTVAVSSVSGDPYTNYKATLDTTKTATEATDYLTDLVLTTFTPNNVAETVTVKFFNGDKPMAYGKKVYIDTNSANISVSKKEATVDILGCVEFDVSASREGNYYIYLTVDGVEFRVKVGADNTSAAYIKTVKQPAAPQALYESLPTVRFQVTDINSNIVKAADKDDAQGMTGIFNNNGTNKDYKGKYVVLTSKPAASKLTSKDFTLVWNNAKNAYDLTLATTAATQIMDAEGTYEFKVILDNGNFATASFEIKQFQTPVELKLTYAAPTVELGGVLYKDELKWIDANGVEKDATGKVELAATGYAVQNFNNTSGTITAKSDEKYVGSTITVTASDSRYNLVTSVDVKVANEAKELKFVTNTGDVDVNNVITVMVVDADGNRVAVGGNGTDVATEISYIVLDKPADAKVAVSTAGYDNDLTSAGTFKMNLTSNKVGNVTVQAIVKVTNRTTADNATQYIYQDVVKYYDKDGKEVAASVALDKDGKVQADYTAKVETVTVGYTDNANTQQYVTKYYAGTQVFAIGTEGTGDVVVMSIGSDEIVINDKVAKIDCAPFIQNNRTFVPFRALAEAFGADVAYDEATQAVTAELNGVTVVMTIGSATYTINGVENVMDVAPFIVDSRTVVPVRFAAQAFGINPVVTTNPADGTTADILFVL